MRVALGLLLAAAVPVDLAVEYAGRAYEVARTRAAVTWRAAVPVDLAVDDAGRAYEVARTPAAVTWATAAPGEPFGPRRVLLRTRRPMRAAVAADGTGVIALQTAPHRRVRVVGFDARGRLGRSQVVARGPRTDLAALAVARGGAAVVVWFRHRPDGRWRLEAAVRDPGAAAFRSARAVSPLLRMPCCTAVGAAIGERGDAVLTWRSTLRPALWAALRSGHGRFRPPQRLAPQAGDVPRVAIGADGTAAVTYSRQRVPPRPGDGLRLQRAAAGEPFGAAELVNPSGGVTPADVTVTGGGHTAVAWIAPDDARVRVSEAGPRMPLGAGVVLGAGARSHAPVVDATDDGRAVVAWTAPAASRPALDEHVVVATRTAAAAAFGAPVALGAPWPVAAPRRVRLSPGGGALVLWTGTGRRRSADFVTRTP